MVSASSSLLALATAISFVSAQCSTTSYACPFSISVNSSCPLGQLSDGQVRAAAATLSQISDGQTRVCAASGTNGTSTFTFSNSTITDQSGRTCSISSQNQFQCNTPPTVGSSVSGFAVCSNGSLTYQGSSLFYACNATGQYAGYNIYSSGVNMSTVTGCTPIMLNVSSCAASSSSSTRATSSSSARITTSTSSVRVSSSAVASTSSAVRSSSTVVVPVTTTSATVATTCSTTTSAPTGCVSSYACPFSLTVNSTCPLGQLSDGQVRAAAASLSQISDGQTRVCAANGTNGTSTFTLTNGSITDQSGRTCSISIQNQLQCNNPPTVGSNVGNFSVCSGTLQFLGSSLFYACNATGQYAGYNIYSSGVNMSTVTGCSPIMLTASGCNSTVCATTTRNISVITATTTAVYTGAANSVFTTVGSGALMIGAGLAAMMML